MRHIFFLKDIKRPPPEWQMRSPIAEPKRGGLACQVTRGPRLHKTKSFEGFQPSTFFLISNNYYTFLEIKWQKDTKL
jgi:hypothetical protein